MKKTLLLAAAACMLAALPAQASLVINGDFESGLTGWSSDPNRTSSDVAVVLDGATGNHVAKLTMDPNAYMSFFTQLVPVTPGQSYIVSFDAKTTGAGGAWDTFFDGASLVEDFGAGPLKNWAHYQFTVKPTHFEPGNNVPLLFDFYQYSDESALLLDNVNVVNAAPVPEPSTYIAGAMLLLPFGVTALRRMRKNTAA